MAWDYADAGLAAWLTDRFGALPADTPMLNAAPPPAAAPPGAAPVVWPSPFLVAHDPRFAELAREIAAAQALSAAVSSAMAGAGAAPPALPDAPAAAAAAQREPSPAAACGGDPWAALLGLPPRDPGDSSDNNTGSQSQLCAPDPAATEPGEPRARKPKQQAPPRPRLPANATPDEREAHRKALAYEAQRRFRERRRNLALDADPSDPSRPAALAAALSAMDAWQQCIRHCDFRNPLARRQLKALNLESGAREEAPRGYWREVLMRVRARNGGRVVLSQAMMLELREAFQLQSKHTAELLAEQDSIKAELAALAGSEASAPAVHVTPTTSPSTVLRYTALLTRLEACLKRQHAADGLFHWGCQRLVPKELMLTCHVASFPRLPDWVSISQVAIAGANQGAEAAPEGAASEGALQGAA
ncbi:hypothetical protein Rsub_11305 [Raphidocelis subcapitata]|uniref:Uncharacterized protein n=1 Tax=Raphidocelis subcapitata TaxID=307507 RepID=A0A2V0PL20_9CHLO|nr:hypothetical protein Rsub_11305 [Raphidocelis subcapitata]|eukprot:GBF98580.1 hypothetical protein Rsub_11305 [Raphidocelis subcapitata]